MNFGFVKVSACTPKIKVADVEFNVSSIIDGIKEGCEKGVEVAVFPELCITGSTCGDLFYSDVLINGALSGLNKIAQFTEGKSILVFVGLPFRKDGFLYNVVAGVYNGKVLGLVSKTCTNGSVFSPCEETSCDITLFNYTVRFGNDIIFFDKTSEKLKISVDIGEDIYMPISPSTVKISAGVNVIVNPCAFPTTVDENQKRKTTLSAISLKNTCAIISANAGDGESTTDCVYGGYNVISENGETLENGKVFTTGLNVSDIDTELLYFKRAKTKNIENSCGFTLLPFLTEKKDFALARKFVKSPFILDDVQQMEDRSELILNIQAEGLKKRIEHTFSKSVVIGLSGGLDSTLAFIVCMRAMEKSGRSSKEVIAVTMPCFGTTSRTYLNTVKLAKSMNATLKKVDVSKSVTRHLKDINHTDGVLDATFENAQARERTQVLMDIANMNNGIVVGTGDLSELALGWATYNGDHMSMYGVNATIPKTLVRVLVKHCADNGRGKLKATLLDILDTPVSPELLPAKDGEISQKTEDIVGPYTLHDFYLYHFIENGYSPAKILFIAKQTFKGEFDEQTILKWLKTFFKRFFMQQFKRSCVPDGVSIGLSLSPRGAWKMPSDAVAKLWLNELENL